ncbi:MAG: CoA-binding protein [Deltaproteobacteria bacterium]|nr:CoA-binding protein [Deltaproteobacteria bacterium]
MNQSLPDLDRFFNPRHLALIGASGTPGKWGFFILLNIIKGNFQGTLYPVNARAKEVLGYPCYARIAEVPDPVDLAVIATPAETVLGLIDECGQKRIPNLVVITSDFSETGAEGAALERAVVDKARGYGIRLVGPNTMGLYSAHSSLHALMPPVEPLKGPVSMFSQSGNIGTQILAWGVDAGIGFEKFVSSGNEGDLTCVDYLQYFAQDDPTRIVLAYLEGVDPDSGFLAAARQAARKKPVVIFKGGRTQAGTRAAASHSGALAGSYRIYQGVFRQTGLIEARTTQEIMDCTKALAAYPIPRGNRVAILTRGGGWGVITTDACEENGLVIPPLPEAIVRKLDRILPRYWSRNNPVDMAAVVTAEPFMECLAILAAWEGVDAIIALGGRAHIPGRNSINPDVAARLAGSADLLKQIGAHVQAGHKKVLECIHRLIRETGKPIISVTLGPQDYHKESMEVYQLASYPNPERAVRALRMLVDYGRYLSSPEPTD